MINSTLPRITVLGLGNILLGDEGAGVRLVERMQTAYAEHPDVELVDGGTSGLDLLPHLRKDGILIIVDAIAPIKGPGHILRLQDSEVPAFLDAKLSPHQIGLPDLIATATLMDCTPKKIVLIGIEPHSIETGITLSPCIHEKIPILLEMVLKELAAEGITLEHLNE